MKKLFVAMAVVATALLSSCVQEKSFSDLTPIGENGIAFVLNNTSTRSMEAMSEIPVEKGVTIPVSTGIQDEEFFLEETIEDLNCAPATKGAPAYTVNVGTIYKTMGVYVDPSVGKFGGDAIFQLLDDSMTTNANGGKGWRYNHDYDGSPWPDETTPVDFYLRMPAVYDAMDEFDYTTTGSIAFDYNTPRTAQDQKDILFGYTRLTKEKHDSYLTKGGAPVTMSHALTGLKFRNGSDNTGALKTVITKIELIGLKGSGHCVIAPGTSVEWSDPVDSPYSFIQVFDNPEYDPDLGKDNSDGTVDYVSGEDNKFGDSWYSAGKDEQNPSNMANLNDEKGSMTFWLVPQIIGDGVKMKVTFRVKTKDTPNGTLIDSDPDRPTEITQTIDLSKYNKGVEWKAGQLRTYTLSPKDVDVEIFDTMKGYVKNNLHVTNTGNTDEYIRMHVVGNWYGWKPGTTEAQMKTTEPSILVGYKYAGNESASQIAEGDNIDTMQIPWTREETMYGEFDTSFTGGALAEGRTDWIRASGGFYYPSKLGAGQAIEPDTTPLFDSYTLYGDKVPTIYLPSNTSDIRQPAVGVHLVMEVVVQAIAVPKNEDGTDKGWQQAWYEATGNEKLNPNPNNTGE
ncbi:MAG: hypothetical protein J6T22_03300 [Bacteroidales bacterium]|nr:hypothetical protein [Bacteroidales bacterium]